MHNIVNNYYIGSHIELLICDDEGTRRFIICNTDSGREEEISERAAMLMCISSDSVITEDNWEDFCTARGIFTEDN